MGHRAWGDETGRRVFPSTPCTPPLSLSSASFQCPMPYAPFNYVQKSRLTK
ncbi:hypothetical protein H6H03_24385 [Nostoc paludosum FACHB-159]|uniref:Uncharacterized protein n=1 Tax=Nostoc paludosum FACHB-159 TaxID=2692908 RepID=A0ABR8KBS4_9NOSO|nr:hypothetical protein [Nostoc paludosum FACHB-159]